MDNKIGKLSVRNKSAIFLGLVAVAAIIAGAVVYYQSQNFQPGDNLSPALNVSKQRAGTSQTASGKKIIPTRAPQTK
ncbi:MAG: hypothetical protein P4L74_05420 [Candidatus Doudnabacteria bacterium]|nr:hypothetical protein [Candidatus Doudnabacteria bacterium]